MQSKIPGVLLLAALAAVPAAAADATANRPAKQKTVTLIVPFTHGGPTDALAQPLAQAMTRALGQTVIEKNVAGAGGTLGAEQVAKAKPDGNTLLLSNIGHATSSALYRRLRYDPVNDFAPIGLVADVPMTLLGRPRLPAADFKELLSYIHTRPGKVTYGHAGIGSASHLCGLLFMKAVKTDFATVAYPGARESLADLLSGQFDLSCDQTTNTLAAIREDRVKSFAVTTKARLRSLPEVPTLAESGLQGFELTVWHGLYAPKGTPQAVLDKLSAALRTALQDPELVAKFAESGVHPAAADQARPEALRARLLAERKKWTAVIKDAGIYAD